MEVLDTKELLHIALDAIVLECKDVDALSEFYIQLLGWKKNYGEDGEWTDIISPSSGVKIAFQKNEDYISPVWPDQPGAQQQMAHLDFTVHDKKQMELAVQKAISCGAMKASVQYDAEKWTTMIDPAGHPFCFVIW
jgi:catechol 2,3-dioxygenase-like lactoylglutathione lyase family enzyme